MPHPVYIRFWLSGGSRCLRPRHRWPPAAWNTGSRHKGSLQCKFQIHTGKQPLLAVHRFTYLWVNKSWLWRTQCFWCKIRGAVAARSADGVRRRRFVQVQELQSLDHVALHSVQFRSTDNMMQLMWQNRNTHGKKRSDFNITNTNYTPASIN
jgi:hypothetical protein